MICRAILLCSAALGVGSGQSARAQDSSNAGFFEPFDTLSPEIWNVSDGWSNGRWQSCTWSRQNVSVADGILTLSITDRPGVETDTADVPADGNTGNQSADTDNPEDKSLLCGEIQTRERYAYGTYEVRMKTGQGSGMNAAFFTYIGPIHNAPHDEIDIEVLTRDPSRVSFNTYVDGEPFGGDTAEVPGGADSRFVRYAFEWAPDLVRWFVDGQLVHEATAPLPTEPQKIWLSHWSTATLVDWMGEFDASALPARLDIDWVAFTPPGQSCLFPDSITCMDR